MRNLEQQLAEKEKYTYTGEEVGKIEQNYDNQIECLEKEFAELEAKLAESEKQFIVANNLRKNSDEVLLNYKTKK